MSMRLKRFLQFLFGGCLAVVAIQLIPYGRNHSNPPVVHEPTWNNASTRALAKRACFDCHSYETVWAWYSKVAAASWLVQYDVDKGRKELNFSDWQHGARKAERPEKIREEVSEGGMPPIQYRLVHPEARLSDAEKRQLIEGLAATSKLP